MKPSKTEGRPGSKDDELFRQASAAREKSYSPYSNRKVGAAILTSDGKIYSGCNIENSSYGGTICAERVAIHKAVSELGKIVIREVMVVTDADPPWPPCGLCRQVIAEFGPDCAVRFGNLDGKLDTLSFRELFPHAFTPEHLIDS